LAKSGADRVDEEKALRIRESDVKRYHLIIDVEKCENCSNCFLACKDEHVGNDWPGYTMNQPNLGSSWIKVLSHERGTYPLIDVAYLPVPCMHCDDAPCIKASGGAITKRLDGAVLIDSEKAKGRRDLLNTCPYQAIQWNEVLQVPQKCTLCTHLLDKGWEKPRCVQSCPTGALTFRMVDDVDMKKVMGEEKLEVYKPGVATRPTVLYRNLYRFTRSFIAGSVATRAGGREECVEGARVTLFDAAGKGMAEACTDAFGDFKFDNLEPGSGAYAVRVLAKGCEVGPIAVDLKGSASMGVIYVHNNEKE
jgi:Fe-S-cluster-containing dehydrogenase component